MLHFENNKQKIVEAKFESSRNIRIYDAPRQSLTEKMALVLTSLLRDRTFSVIEAVDLKATTVKALAVIVLVSAHQHIGKARFAHTRCTLK